MNSPLSNTPTPSPCDGKNWFGWPCDEELEKIRLEFPLAPPAEAEGNRRAAAEALLRSRAVHSGRPVLRADRLSQEPLRHPGHRGWCSGTSRRSSSRARAGCVTVPRSAGCWRRAGDRGRHGVRLRAAAPGARRPRRDHRRRSRHRRRCRQDPRPSSGLDQPLLIQFVTWIGQLLRGDLGNSIFSRIRYAVDRPAPGTDARR